jgi:hypothetical protein
MTKEEFLALKGHARVKYVGTRPVSDIFPTIHIEGKSIAYGGYYGSSPKKCVVSGGTEPCATACVFPKIPKNFLKKGVIVTYTSEDTWSAVKGEMSLSFYGGHLTKIVPAEWELVDARKWVEGETQFKLAKSYIPMVARRFKKETTAFLKRYKRNVEYKLDDLPLEKKLKLIMELPPEDKKWFGIMNTDPDKIIELMEKAYEDHAGEI